MESNLAKVRSTTLNPKCLVNDFFGETWISYRSALYKRNKSQHITEDRETSFTSVLYATNMFDFCVLTSYP